jgi:hypothetical protein
LDSIGLLVSQAVPVSQGRCVSTRYGTPFLFVDIRSSTRYRAVLMTMFSCSTLKYLFLHSSFTLGRNSVGWIAALFLPEGEEILQWRDTGRHSCPWFHGKWHARSSSIISKLILAWARKGIVGRGVLVDYYTWALTHAPYNPLERYSIPLSNLKECIRSQNLIFRKGDILIIRSGFTVNYEKLDIPAREAKASINPAHFSV